MEVLVSQRAEKQLEAAHRWWADNRSVEQADRWYNGILEMILSLERDPKRHPLAAENSEFPYDVRELLFGLGRRPTHRVLFTIRPDCVLVFSIRHVAQQPATPDDY